MTQVEIPTWVAQIFPNHVQGRSPHLKRRFSELGDKPRMSSNIGHETGPATLVTFSADHGMLNTAFMHPLTVVTPAMVTAFPRLQANQLDDSGNPKAPELDLTMKGAGEAQERFRKQMDSFDNHLLEFMVDNQSLLGKKNLAPSQVEMSQRKLFKARISTKTGRQYPNACVVRYKGRDGPLQVVDKDLNPIDLEKDPEAIGFNTIVRAILKYSGGYCRGGAFGNSWELICVQVLGQVCAPSITESAADLFSALPLDSEDMWPQL